MRATLSGDLMNAIDLLTRQHRTIESTLKDATETEAKTQRSRAVDRIADDLGKHVSSEEQIFYPAVRARRTEDILLESLEEHLSLKRLLADLLELDAEAETWPAKVKVLEEQTRHHHREEEENLFPKVRKLLTEDELCDLGEQIEKLQSSLVRTGQARAVADETDAAAPLT